MNHSVLRCTFAACLLLSITMPAIALADPGIMVHSTVTISMAGAPVTMPPRTITKDQCAPTQHPDVRALVQRGGRNQNCTFPNYKDEGNAISFHMSCSGNPPIEADAHFTYKGDGNVSGSTHAETNMGGQKMTVETTYAQTPTGASCDYTAPAAAH
jgi:hypothetical protein